MYLKCGPCSTWRRCESVYEVFVTQIEIWQPYSRRFVIDTILRESPLAYEHPAVVQNAIPDRQGLHVGANCIDDPTYI